MSTKVSRLDISEQLTALTYSSIVLGKMSMLKDVDENARMHAKSEVNAHLERLMWIINTQEIEDIDLSSINMH